MSAPDLWRDARKIVLASTSTTRLKLLTSAGLPCQTMAPDVDERALAAPLEARGESPEEIARILARAKAVTVSNRRPGELVLAADQTLALDGRMFNKPGSLDEAATHLRLLSGRTHVLHAAAVVVRNGEILFESVELAHLTMRRLSESFIETYLKVAGESVRHSVGGYQVEGLGIHLFERIEGDHATILGLPLMPLLAFFRAQGLVLS